MVQGIFWVLIETLGIFGRFLFLPPFDHLCHLKSGVPPPPPPHQAVCMSTLTLPWQPSLAMTMFCKICNFPYRQSELATHVASIYADLWEQKKAFTYEKSSTPIGLVWETNMAAVSLFWDTNMAAMTSCENTQYGESNA